MNLIQQHLLIVISSFFLIISHNFNNYFVLFSIILFIASISRSISYNSSRTFEYITTSILSLIFFYAAKDLIFLRNYHFFQIKLYMMSLCFFHFMEYTFVLIYHPKKLGFDSFLLNHSREYIIAITISFIEYFLEYYFFEDRKINSIFILFGIFLVLVGHIFRSGSMFTAKSNFTHLVAYTKKESHILVKSGLYSLSRHPSYFGFFAWTVGTQFLLFNPVCIIGYTIATWLFFYNRIKDEEIYLITFFGKEYIEYKKSVPILIPCKIFKFMILVISLDQSEEEQALEYYYTSNYEKNKNFVN